MTRPQATGADPDPLTIYLAGKMQSGKNRILTTRKGRRYPTGKFKVWRAVMLSQLPRVERPFVGRVALTVTYTPGDRIRRDLPGILDALLHVLERGGIVQDDAQVKRLFWEEHPVNRKVPGCVMTVTAF